MDGRIVDIAQDARSWTPTKLCEACEGVFQASKVPDMMRWGVLTDRDIDSGLSYFATKEQEKSVSQGCKVCWPFLLQLRQSNLHEWIDSNDIILTVDDGGRDPRRDVCVLEITFHCFDRKIDVHRRIMRLVPKELMMCYQSERTLTRRTLIKSWFNICETHAHCAADLPYFCPARLVEVGPTWQRVVERPPTHVVYLTLSHRWTKTETTLQAKNLEDMKLGISIGQLSGDVAAGIRWTRELGFRYIWIDTFCILQDSVQDWQSEAEHMGEIYKHGWCNLAASDGAEGEVQPGISKPPDEKLVSVVHDLQSEWSYAGVNRWCLIDVEYWQREWPKRELNTRGWVYQEALLSRGVIHFHGELLLWQCGEMTASESFPCGLPPKEIIGRAQASLKLTGDKFQQRTQAVAAYIERQLTNPKDKLYAFAGIAAHLRFDDWYHAGIWGQDTVSQLLWSPHTGTLGRTTTSYCTEANAPSWSWANVDTRVECRNHHYSERSAKEHVEILGVNPKTHELRVRGVLFCAKSYRFLSYIVPFDGRDHGVWFYADIISGDRASAASAPLNQSEAPQGLHFLRMQSAPGELQPYVYGLDLLAVPGRQGFYVRVGWFKALPLPRDPTSDEVGEHWDESSRGLEGSCGRDAYLPEEDGVIVII